MKTAQLPPPGQYVVANVRTVTALETGAVRIAGVANDAEVTDSYGTRIKFTQRALEGFKSNPVLLYNHDTDNPIGTVTSLEYRGSQLWAEAEIHPEARTPTGSSIGTLARDGVLRAFSVRFADYKEKRAADHIAIEADGMDELSIVTLPSNKPALFQARSKGVELHGAEELLSADTRLVDARPAEARAAGPLELSTLTSRLYKAVQALEGDSWYGCSLVAVYEDYCVYCDYEAGRYYRLGYGVDADGNVSLTGAAQEVIPSWVDVNAGESEPERAAAPTIRLAEADIQAIVSRIRADLSPVSPDSAPDEVITVVNIIDPPAPTLEDVRSALRSAAQSVNSAPPG